MVLARHERDARPIALVLGFPTDEDERPPLGWVAEYGSQRPRLGLLWDRDGGATRGADDPAMSASTPLAVRMRARSRFRSASS